MLLPFFCLVIVKFSENMICSLFTLRVIRELCYFLQEKIKEVKSLLLCSLTRNPPILSQRSDSLHLLSLFWSIKTSPVLWTTPKVLLQRNFWNAPCRSATITRKPMCISLCILLWCCMCYIRHSDWSEQTRRDDTRQDQILRSNHTRSGHAEPDCCSLSCFCTWPLLESDALNLNTTGPNQG